MLKRITEIRNNILISKRIKILVLIISILILILGTISVSSIYSINNRINQINEVYLKNMVKLSELIENIYSVLIESHIIDEKSLSDNSIDNALNVDLLGSYLSEYEYLIKDEARKTIFKKFVLEFQNFISILKRVNSLELQSKYELAKEVKTTEEIASFRKLQGIIKQMLDYNVEGIENANKLVKDLENKVLFRIYFLTALLLLLTFLVSSFLLRDIRKSLHGLIGNLTVLKNGEVPERNIEESKNEMGTMAKLVNSVTDNLDSLNKFANDISRGNYSSDYTPASDSDMLGKALVNLRNNLRVTKEEDERRKLEDERRNWTNKGHALFGEILRQRSRGLSQLADDVIKNLVYYLKANQGGLFLINDTEDISKIELVSAFAYDRKKYVEREINIGDGLIGTVALERNTIYLKELPEDYIEIESGLGDSKPKSLLIVPLKFEDDILGIVEMASFKEFERYEIKFVEEVAQSIASTLLTARINAKTEKLLNDSQKKSEELAAQDMEVRQNMEEMRAAQELAKKREAALSGIISAVDNTLMKGEYELDGTLISVNNRHLQTMGYQLKEIKGKNIEFFIPSEELEGFRKVWANVVAGNPRQLEVKRKTKSGEELWLVNQYTPVTDISGKINRVLYFAHDITKYKKNEEKAKEHSVALETKEVELNEKLSQLERVSEDFTKKSNELNSILGAIGSEQVIIEFDLKGHVLKVNSKFEELSGLTSDKINGENLSDIFKLNKTKEEFEAIWAKVIAGNTAIEENCYILKNSDIFWLREYYAAVFDSQNIPYKIVSIAIDITRSKTIEQKNIHLAKELEEGKGAKFDTESEVNKMITKGFNEWFPSAVLDHELNFISINYLFTNQFKYSIKDLKSKHISDILKEDGPKEKLKEAANLKPGGILELEADIRNKKGESLSYAIKFILIEKENLKEIHCYFVKKEDFESGNDIFENQQKEIVNKESQIKKLEVKIKQMASQLEKKEKKYSESDVDDLYNKWLKRLRE